MTGMKSVSNAHHVPSDSFDVRIEPVLPRDLQGKVGRARKVRGEAEVLQHEAAIARADVAADLVQTAHLTVRDAGRVLGSPINGSPSCSRQLRGKASAPMGVAFALLAPADPRAIAGLDHAGTRLDDLHPVVLHVVIRLKTRANLDAPGAST